MKHALAALVAVVLLLSACAPGTMRSREYPPGWPLMPHTEIIKQPAPPAVIPPRAPETPIARPVPPPAPTPVVPPPRPPSWPPSVPVSPPVTPPGPPSECRIHRPSPRSAVDHIIKCPREGADVIKRR